MEKIKKQVKDAYIGVHNVIENIENIVIPACILIASYYNFVGAKEQRGHISEFEFVVRVAASIIPTLVAFYLFWKHFSQKRGK